MIAWLLLTAAAFCFVVALYMALGSAPVRRLWDRLQHPGEYSTQRQYRRWRQAVPQSEPYLLTSVRVTTPREPGLSRLLLAESKPDPGSPVAAATEVDGAGLGPPLGPALTPSEREK